MNTTVKNRINFNNDYSYIEPIYVPEGGDKSFGGEKKRSIEKYKNILVLFPNPSNAYFTVDYRLRDAFNSGKLMVLDLNGKIIYQAEINYTKDQVLIAVEGWTAGQYTCIIIADGQTRVSKKITVIK